MKKKETFEDIEMGSIDTTPTKRVLWTGVAICAPKNAITEIQDNIIDYVMERLNNGSLSQKSIKSSYDFTPKEVRIKWNLGIPKNKRLALLTPGLHESEGKGSIGTWSMGGKIGIHALGDNIKIRTCAPDDTKVIVYTYPSGWLRDSNDEYNMDNERDWKVQKNTESVTDDKDFTEIIVERPTSEIKRFFDRKDEENYSDYMERILTYVRETYGLTIINTKDDWGVTFDISINGMQIVPITYCTHDDIKSNFAIVPGFEPTWHEYEFKGLNIRILVGCTAKMDTTKAGMYFYGNHNRLFARHEMNQEYLSEIDVTHPQHKSWQMHVFLNGDTSAIPWNSPLKEGVYFAHPTMETLRPILNKLPLPYIQLVLSTHAPERVVFTEQYLKKSEEEKKNALFGKELNKEELWLRLPKIAKIGRKYTPELIEEYYHGDLTDAIKERMREPEPKWAVTIAKKWLRSKGISQATTKEWDDEIEALWAFNEFIDPTEEQLTSEVTSVTVLTEEGESEDEQEPTEPTKLAAETKAEEKEEEGEKEVISGRIKISDKTRIGISAHSDKPTEILNFLVEMFNLCKRLLDLPSIPSEVRSQGGMKEKMETLIQYYESQKGE